MADQQNLSVSPDERIRRILVELLVMLDKSESAIHEIAEQERNRLGDDTSEGEAWWAFAGLGALSDV